MTQTPNPIPFGFLPLHKPVGPTSHDMVAKVRRALPRGIRVGHTGTLDPFASGVLLMGVGKATKFADDVHRLDKHYRAVIVLGVETDTLDLTGETTREADVPALNEADLARLAERFIGGYDQIPPAFSAKKVNGKRGYELAREKREVELEPCRVAIHELRLEILDERRLACELTCGTGAYVRSLARDVAAELGTVGHLETLVRTRVGNVFAEEAHPPETLGETDPLTLLRPVTDVLTHLPTRRLTAAQGVELSHGRPFPGEDYPEDFLAVCGDPDDPDFIFRCCGDAALGQVQSKLMCYRKA